MKVAVKVGHGTTFFDGDDQPVAVILSAKDRLAIASLPPDVTVYCTMPQRMARDVEQVALWVQELKKLG